MKKYERISYPKIKQQIEAGIYPGASLRIIGMVNGLIATGEADPEIGEQTCQGLAYDLASEAVVGVGTVLTFLWALAGN